MTMTMPHTCATFGCASLVMDRMPHNRNKEMIDERFAISKSCRISGNSLNVLYDSQLSMS